MAKANGTEGLSQVYSFFNTSTPRIFADIDRRKAELLGVPPDRVFEALQVYLGSAYAVSYTHLVAIRAARQDVAAGHDAVHLHRRDREGARKDRLVAGPRHPGGDQRDPRRLVQHLSLIHI